MPFVGLQDLRLGLGLRWRRHRGDERGEDLLGDRRVELRLRRIEVRPLGRLEARDGRAAGPALGEMGVQAGEVGLGKRLVGALGEQPWHRGAVARGDDVRARAADIRVALMSSASGIDGHRVAGLDDGLAKAGKGVGGRRAGLGFPRHLAAIGHDGRAADGAQRGQRGGIALAHS